MKLDSYEIVKHAYQGGNQFPQDVARHVFIVLWRNPTRRKLRAILLYLFFFSNNILIRTQAWYLTHKKRIAESYIWGNLRKKTLYHI